MEEIACRGIGERIPMHASYDMEGKIRRGGAAATGDAVAVIDEQVLARLGVDVKFPQRVDVLIVGGCSLALQKVRTLMPLLAMMSPPAAEARSHRKSMLPSR